MISQRIGQIQKPGDKPRNVRMIDRTIPAGVITFESADATPSVRGANVFITAGTTAITNFLGGELGQTIRILATDSITITDNASIILNGSVNYAMTDTDTLTLTMYEDGVWSEDARSVN